MQQEGFNKQNNGQQQRPVVNQPETSAVQSKSKKEKHKLDAEKQVMKIILEFKKLGEIALKHKGDFSKEDTDKIFEAFRVEIAETKKNFRLEKDNLDFSL